ncbi:uncharacterized protein LOC134190042 isoform X2 [Corticium candelabrum]|uniref:uncharacterized protein LOC134190042 isoform X2 n=1 Tax=Corticium candelabrum TaxID=121492 RepID=UPI002E272022|nr:uncharacterized protein LOC134190042 isoform X2 [Corticium candelabrum]
MSERDITSLNSQLVEAVRKSADDEAERLLDLGASADVCAEDGLPVLVIACLEGYSLVSKLLVKRGADVNKADSIVGVTALVAAALYGDDEMVDFLLSVRADAGQKTRDDESAYDAAIYRRHLSAAGRLVLATQTIEDVTTCPSMFDWACENANVDVARIIIERLGTEWKDDDLGRTLLHNAAHDGSRDVVDLLLAFKADADAVDKDGNRPFDLAFTSGHMSIAGRMFSIMQSVEHIPFQNVCQLLQFACSRNEVDVATKIGEQFRQSVEKSSGRTLLHFAAQLGHREAVECLLEKKVNADAKDKDGNRPFDLAFTSGHMSIAGRMFSIMQSVEHIPFQNVCQLLQFACSRNEVNVATKIGEQFRQSVEESSGRTLLHFAAQLGHREAVECLLEKKINADAKDKNGKRPYQLTDGELRRRLKKANDEQRTAIFYAKDTVRLETIKLCFIGSDGTGKTTLMEALKRGWLERRFTNENQEDDPNSEEKYKLDQRQFHKTLGLFFSSFNSLFILLVSLVRGKERRICSYEELRDELHYWLSFLRASLDGKFIPTVLIMASRGDYYRDGQHVLRRVVDFICELFIGKINIIEDCLVLDCRKSDSPEMRQLKNLFCNVKQRIQQSAPLYPRLCQPVVSKLLPALRKTQKDPFMETETLMERIEQEACPGQEKKVIEKVVGFLEESGEIAVVGDVSALNPACVHQYAIRPIIASEDFNWHVMSKRKDGTVTREEAKLAICRFLRDHQIDVQLDWEKVLAVNESLSLCFKVEGRDDMYMFPALLPHKDLSAMWESDDSKSKTVHVGRRQVCSSQMTIFSPCTFGKFQSKVCTTIDPEARLWRNGLILLQGDTVYGQVECLVAMIDPVRSVDFVCRGGKGTEQKCVSLLDTVMSLWRDILYSDSPDTEYQTEYLSRQHLDDRKELKLIATYSEEKIKEAKEKEEGANASVKQVVGDKVIVESLGALLVVQPYGQPASVPSSQVFDAVIRHGTSQWYSFGLKLNFNHNQLEALCHNKVSYGDKLSAIIHERSQQAGVENMDNLLLEACKRLPNPIYSNVAEELGIHR